MASFPSNPVDGTIVELRPGEFHIFNSGTQSWTRIDGYKFGLATQNRMGLMSNEDLKKLNSLILPPPNSSLTGDNCNIVFKNGTVSLYSTDDSLSIKNDLSIYNPSSGVNEIHPWQIHENTVGYDFKLNLNRLVEEIESRGRLSKVQLSGPDGDKGPVGDKGIDNLDTGPKGVKGSDGANSPFLGTLLSEDLSVEQLEESKNKAIISIETENAEDGNYLIVTRANIGDPDASPDRVKLNDFESPWVLVLDKQDGKITRKVVASSEECVLSCKVSVTSIYYLNIDGIIETLKERYEYKLAELKANKEILIKSWLRVMSAIYNEQKYALCCALENCETRKRNTNDRRWIESQRIQAAAGNMELQISTDEEDRVTSDAVSSTCVADEKESNNQSDSSKNVIYGKECDDYLVKVVLDAKIHNKDPRKNKSKFGYLSAKLPKGDYVVEILDCCANFTGNPYVAPKNRKQYTRQGMIGEQSINLVGSRDQVVNPPGTLPKDKCNVKLTNKIGTQPGDSIGILKNYNINCNGDINSAWKYCSDDKNFFDNYDHRKGGLPPVPRPIVPAKLDISDYLTFGYIGSDCRAKYDKKFEKRIPVKDALLAIGYFVSPRGPSPDPNLYGGLFYSTTGSSSEGRSAIFEKNGLFSPEVDAVDKLRFSYLERGIHLSYRNDSYTSNFRNKLLALKGEQLFGTPYPVPGQTRTWGDFFYSDASQLEKFKVELNSSSASTLLRDAELKELKSGIVDVGSPAWERRNPNVVASVNRTPGEVTQKILGPGGYVVGEGDKYPDCKAMDCPPEVLAEPREGKWGGKVAILRKIPSLNFKPAQSAEEGGTELTAGDFESYEDFDTLLEREIYTIDFGYFDELTEAKNKYIGSSTTFSHAGGTIKLWIADPTSSLKSADGGIIIGIKSRKCLEQVNTLPGSGLNPEITAGEIPNIYVYRNKIDINNIIGIIKPYQHYTGNNSENYKVDLLGSDSVTTGPRIDPDVSKIFFVLANDGIGFYHVHTTENDPTIVKPKTVIFSNYTVENNTQRTNLISQTPSTEYEGGTKYIADQFADIYESRFSLNEATTKGVAFSELSGDDWTITLDEISLGSINKLVAVDSDSELLLAKGNLSNQVENAKDFMPCRSLFRACNVPLSLGGRNSLGIINRSRDSFRICRILPEWKVPEDQNPPSGDNVWIRKPATYPADNEPCGASLCDANYQVTAGTDGLASPIVESLADPIFDIHEVIQNQPFARLRIGFLEQPRYYKDYDFSVGANPVLPSYFVEQAAEKEITLSPNIKDNKFYTITGYVYDQSDPRGKTPVVGALVEIFGHKDGQLLGQSITDENGMYAIKMTWWINSAGLVSQNNYYIQIKLYNAPKSSVNWTFDNFKAISASRGYLRMNREWRSNYKSFNDTKGWSESYTENGIDPVVSVMTTWDVNKLSYSSLLTNFKVEAIRGVNVLSMEYISEDAGGDGDWNDFTFRIYKGLGECPNETTSNLKPIFYKGVNFQSKLKDNNYFINSSSYEHEYGDVVEGPVFNITSSDLSIIDSKIECRAVEDVVGSFDFADDLVDGKSVDFLVLVNSTKSIKPRVEKFAKNLTNIVNYFSARGVNNFRVAVARFGSEGAGRYYTLNDILTDQPFKRLRPGFLQTPRYFEDYDFELYGKGKNLPIGGTESNVGENFYTLTGYVYDNTSDIPKPINGALVHLKLLNYGKIIQSTVTDENGMYAFKIKTNWNYPIRYESGVVGPNANVIPNAEIQVDLYNAPKMNGKWKFDNYTKAASLNQMLLINDDKITIESEEYTEDGNSIISTIGIQEDRGNQAVSAGMIFKDIKVELINGENNLTFKIAVDDDARDADFDDFVTTVRQKITEECPNQITSNLNPMITKTHRIAIGFSQPNSYFGYQFGDVQSGPIFSIDKSDAETILSQINCGAASIVEKEEQIPPDFEVLQSFTYNTNSAIQALESIQCLSSEKTSSGFAALKVIAEQMPWFNNSIKIATIITDVNSNTNQLQRILDYEGEIITTEITSGTEVNITTGTEFNDTNQIDTFVEFTPDYDVPNAYLLQNNILTPGGIPDNEIIQPHIWERSDNSTIDLYQYLGSTEDTQYIKTSNLQPSAYGYIAKVSSNQLDALDLIQNNFEYTTLKISFKLNLSFGSDDKFAIALRILNALPPSIASSESVNINDLTLGVCSIVKDGDLSLVRGAYNVETKESWEEEREGLTSGDKIFDLDILSLQTSSGLVDIDSLLKFANSESTDPEKEIGATSPTIIEMVFPVKKQDIINNPMYVQIAATKPYGGDSDVTGEPIEFQISNFKISSYDAIPVTFPSVINQTDVTAEVITGIDLTGIGSEVTVQDAFNALRSKKIILNGIVPLSSINNSSAEYDLEYGTINCSSNSYMYAECDSIAVDGNSSTIVNSNRDRIVIVDAWVANQISTSSITFVPGFDPKPLNQRNGIKAGSDGRYCNDKSCGEFGIVNNENGYSKLWVDHGARAVFGVLFYRVRQTNQSPISSKPIVDTYGIPFDVNAPLTPNLERATRQSQFGDGLVYKTGGALFDLRDIDNSSSYYGMPEYQPQINDNPAGVFENVIESTGSSNGIYKLRFDTRNIIFSKAYILVGKYKNQRIKRVTCISNDLSPSQLIETYDYTLNSLDGNRDALITQPSPPIRFGASMDHPEYSRVITVQKGFKGVLEYELTPSNVFPPQDKYITEPSMDLVKDPNEYFPDNAKTTVYQPFWKFSVGLDIAQSAYTSNNLINSNYIEQAKNKGYNLITGRLLDGSIINRTLKSGLAGNGNAYIYGALVNCWLIGDADSQSIDVNKHICSSITDIEGRYALKIPIEWTANKSSIALKISIPIYKQQANDDWQIEPSILVNELMLADAVRKYRLINKTLPNNYYMHPSAYDPSSRFPVSAWRKIFTINNQRFTIDSVNAYLTERNVKSITIQSFFTDPFNYIGSQGSNGVILNPNLLFSSSFIKIDEVYYSQSTNRFLFKIKSDDGNYGTTSDTNRLKGDLLFGGGFIVVSHPAISSVNRNGLSPFKTFESNIEVPIVNTETSVEFSTFGGGIFSIADLVIPAQDDLSANTMKCGAFFHKFTIEKYREYLTRLPRPPRGDCSNTINGGRARRFIRVDGIPLTQEVYNGTIFSVVATMRSLPGTYVKAIIYDNQSRGLVMKGVETSFLSDWETVTWNTTNIDRYINPIAYTQESLNQLVELGYSLDDPALRDTQTRINLLTSQLTIKLKDLFAVALEWEKPDVGIVSFVNDIKVGVRYTNDDGVSGTAYVDIANFEPFGKSVDDDGEIPIVVYNPQIINQISPVPGAYAETVLYLDAAEQDSSTESTRKINNGDSIQIGKFYSKVTFVETIVPYSETYETRLQDAIQRGYGQNAMPPTALVKIGRTDQDTLINLEKLINNSGTNGLEYYDPYIQTNSGSQFASSVNPNIQARSFGRYLKISAREIGIQGNSFAAHIVGRQTDQGLLAGYFPMIGVEFGNFTGTPASSWASANSYASVGPNINEQGYITTMTGGVNEVRGVGEQTIIEPTEEDESAYLENWWVITKAEDYEPIGTRWKEYCPPAIISGEDCQRISVENQLVATETLTIPLSKYILTPRCPINTCDMHYKQVEWYERGWRIGACCGALIEIDGIKWIVVKRSIGVDLSCGGGESEENPCIKQAIESGRGHPAIAWPTFNGEEFIGRPTTGFAKFVRDDEYSNRIIRALSSGGAIEYRGNMTFNDINDKIPFILFPKS